MPHVIVSGEESVSVAIQEVRPEDRAEKVYGPDIAGQLGGPLQAAGLRRPRVGTMPSEETGE